MTTAHKILELVARQIVSAHPLETVLVRKNPKAHILPDCIQTAAGSIHHCDVIMLAIAVKAGSDALNCIVIPEGVAHALKEERDNTIRITMGLQRHGYPNLFTTAVRFALPATLCNMATCLHQHGKPTTTMSRSACMKAF